MKIETKKASLDTVSVEIKALHVSGKQMTLAVFRQLPIEKCTTDAGYLRDNLTFWGTVNYKIKDEGDSFLVADADGRLVRCGFPSCNSCLRWLKERLKEDEKSLANLKSLIRTLDNFIDHGCNPDEANKYFMEGKYFDNHFKCNQWETIEGYSKKMNSLGVEWEDEEGILEEKITDYKYDIAILQSIIKLQDMNLPQLFIAV